jgi:hypothetical protein
VTMSILHDLIPEIIPSQKCHMNVGPIVNCYGATDILNSRLMCLAASKIRLCRFSLLFTFIHHIFHGNLGE